MKKDDLLRFCRYYRGESDNPFKNDDTRAILWDYERTWVSDNLKDGDFSDYLNDYIAVGLQDFAKYDDTPVTLKAMLFNRYAKSEYSMQSAVPRFKDFYNKYYR